MKEKELRPSAPDEEDQVHITPGMTKYQKFFAFLGPGILIATVYVDPGQIVVDMESGSVFKYKMLWALLLANGMGLLFQHLCSRLAVVTGRNLAQENRLEYPTHVRVFLWFSVEVASIAADLGYVMGTATAIEILFGVPLHWGVLVTGLDTFLALGLQQFGIRKVEALVGALFGLVVACYMVELSFVKPDLGGVLDGMIPRLWHSNERFGVGVWLELLCANLGAAVCPPNFFLQSALVRTRKIERTAAGVREAFEYNLYETGICLGLATAINVAMLLLAAGEMFPERVKSLSQGADLLNNTLGGLARYAFAVAMLCAGQSSSLTGVLSTQYIMEGFFQLSVPGWIIRLCTRTVAIVPAFLAVYWYGPEAAADTIEQAQVVVSFVVPFCVIPLSKFLCSKIKMGPFKLSPRLAAACWISAGVATALNLVSMCQGLMGLDGVRMAPRIVLTVTLAGVYLALKRPIVATEGLWSPEEHAAQGDKWEAALGRACPDSQKSLEPQNHVRESGCAAAVRCSPGARSAGCGGVVYSTPALHGLDVAG
mmetsp:Transcript_24202/g.76109  ORF Transcript_24202/g.76109 Transcript_24202/m.76109 type:complete len:540 (-) Transcript_24202:109-1728(-)